MSSHDPGGCAPPVISDETEHQISDVTRQLVERDQAGRKKYGTSLDRTDLTLTDWLQHMAEELLDAAGYALAAKRTAIAPAEAQPDRMAIKLLVAAGFVTEAKANEALNIAHGFDKGPLAPPSAPVGVEAVRGAWLAAITLANNICVQESDRENDRDGDTAWIDGTVECAKRIREYAHPTDAELMEMLDEAGANAAKAALAQQPAAGEEIMVNAAHDVYTLPLQPSGLLSGPRFVVCVPGPEQPAAVDGAMVERAFNAWCDVAEVDEWRVRNPREAITAALTAALAVQQGGGDNG